MNKSVTPVVEKLGRRQLRCGEGPVWDDTTGTLYYTESAGKAIYAFDPVTGRHRIISRAVAASLCLHADGGLVACGADGVFHRSPRGRWRSLTRPVAGRIAPDRLNDIVADPAGRVFTGQNVYAPDTPCRPGGLFCLDAGGVRLCADDVQQGNGMDFSPDLKTFYFTDSIRRTVDRFDYNRTTGRLTRRRPFIRFSPEEGLPDGLKVDAAGHVWIALFYGSCLVRVDPDGTVERRLTLPFSQPTSLAFGGPDLTDIYVTSESTFTPGPLVPPGLDRRRPRGGELWRIRQEIRGRPLFRARL